MLNLATIERIAGSSTSTANRYLTSLLKTFTLPFCGLSHPLVRGERTRSPRSGTFCEAYILHRFTSSLNFARSSTLRPWCGPKGMVSSVDCIYCRFKASSLSKRFVAFSIWTSKSTTRSIGRCSAQKPNTLSSLLIQVEDYVLQAI